MTTKKNHRPINLQDAPQRQDSVRRLRQATRLGRCLKLLQLIQGRGRLNAKDLAAENDCVERTVYRDLAALELAGVPWFFDAAEKCYRVRSNYWFPALNLNHEEVLGQAVATSLSKTPGLAINMGAEPTTRRLVASADKRSAEILADAERLVTVFGMKMADHTRHQSMLSTVQWALVNGKQVTGQYRSPYGERMVQLKLHPFRLCLVNQAWYLIGKVSDGGEVKTYRVARFKSLRMIDSAAEVPADFDLRAYFGNAWAVYRGSESFDVELRFDKSAAELVTETNWHPTQKVSNRRDGSVVLTFRVDGLNEILWWILGWTGHVEVLRPVQLRTMIAEKLSKALNCYE